MPSTSVSRSWSWKKDSNGFGRRNRFGRHPATGKISDADTGAAFFAKPIPEFMRKIVQAGGLVPYIRKQTRGRAGPFSSKLKLKAQCPWLLPKLSNPHINHGRSDAIALGFLIEGGGLKIKLTGSKIILSVLQEEGVDTIFGYPGGGDHRYLR